MGYWGWRPLVLSVFISVWIIGCTSTLKVAPTAAPTLPPSVTLIARIPATATPTATPGLPSVSTLRHTATPQPSPTPLVYTVLPGDSWLELSQRFGVDEQSLHPSDPHPGPLRPGQQIVIPNPRNDADGAPIFRSPTPVAIGLTTPTCYETPQGAVLCLGEVANTRASPVGHVAVRVQIIDNRGFPVSELETAVIQRVIPAGQTAPYHALFTAQEGASLAAHFGGVAAAVVRAEAVPAAQQAPLASLIVEDDHAERVDGHYIVTGRVVNLGPQDALALRLIVTFYDQAGRVNGYRVVQADQLAAGETLPVRVEFAAPAFGEVERHRLFVEAQFPRR